MQTKRKYYNDDRVIDQVANLHTFASVLSSHCKLPVLQFMMIDMQESMVEGIPHFCDVRRIAGIYNNLFNLKGSFTFQAHVKFYASSISVHALHLMMNVELTFKAFILLYSAVREIEICFSLVSLSSSETRNRLKSFVTVNHSMLSGGDWYIRCHLCRCSVAHREGSHHYTCLRS